jgi:Ca-activated chloride channel family protein
LSFQNPWGLSALLLLIPLILLYILKKQYEDRVISSTLLWQQVSRELQAAKPWQRLRTRLLLILQISALILFALSLARPAYSAEGESIYYVAVLDTSARMQASDVKPSRMEAAVNALMDFIDGLKARDTMTIVLAGHRPFVLAGPSGVKSELKRHVRQVEPVSGSSDLYSAVQLARTLLQDQGEGAGQIHVFSDHSLSDSVQGNTVFHTFTGNGQNAAVAHLSYELRDGSLTVLSRIANYGDDRDLTLEMKVDGVLQNVKQISLPAGEEANVYWTDLVPDSTAEIEVSILEEDDLMLDNTGIIVINQEYHGKVLLTTERNLFLERAVSLRKDMELFKANPGEILESSDFHLYIYDGYMPENLPENGHIIAFAPPSHEEIGLVVEEEILPEGIKISFQSQYSDLLQYIEPEGYRIAKAGKMNLPEGFTALITDNEGNPLLAAGEREGRKTALFSFSLHDSNLPLKPDFPILIQNLLSWMLPPEMTFPGPVYAGETVLLTPFPDVSHITVTSPAGKKYRFDAYPVPVFYDTRDIGVYEIVQHAENRTYEGRFAVSVPTDEVSDLRSDSPDSDTAAREEAAAAALPFQKDIWMIAGWILLLLLLLEWQVYHHGI